MRIQSLLFLLLVAQPVRALELAYFEPNGVSQDGTLMLAAFYRDESRSAADFYLVRVGRPDEGVPLVPVSDALFPGGATRMENYFQLNTAWSADYNLNVPKFNQYIGINYSHYGEGGSGSYTTRLFRYYGGSLVPVPFDFTQLDNTGIAAVEAKGREQGYVGVLARPQDGIYCSTKFVQLDDGEGEGDEEGTANSASAPSVPFYLEYGLPYEQSCSFYVSTGDDSGYSGGYKIRVNFKFNGETVNIYDKKVEATFEQYPAPNH